MNELQIFRNEEFGQVRTVEYGGKPYFVANDIAKSLGYSRPRQAVIDHCKGSIKMALPSEGGIQDTNIISEGDVYRLIVKSQLPSAEKFEAWVFDEVLPSIRRNGGYIANQENLTPEQIVANALIVAQNIIQQKDKLITELKPKAEFFDAVADSKTAVAIGDVAKVLGIRGLGRNKLFELLREKKILAPDNRPYQRYVDNGYFRVIEQKYTVPGGETQINIKTLVYQKGIDYIRKLVA